MTVIKEQVPTISTPWVESEFSPCEASIYHDQVRWICTRPWAHRVEDLTVADRVTHAAHYDDDEGTPMVGVAWTEETAQ